MASTGSSGGWELLDVIDAILVVTDDCGRRDSGIENWFEHHRWINQIENTFDSD